MNDQKNEKGYVLIIVLFAVVFITVITAVFMRGALSNATQEKTVDENNLVVVSAESGVEYYTWKLKQLYDEKALIAEFDRLEGEARAVKAAAAAEAKKKGITYVVTPIDYDKIQEKIASDFLIELESRKVELLEESAVELIDNAYTHKLVAANVDHTKLNGETWLTVKGIVEGELPNNDQQQRKKKEKELEFELTFIFPKVELAEGSTPVDPDGSTPPGGSIVTMPTLKEPKQTSSPAAPVNVVAIPKPAKTCPSSTGNIANQDCYGTSKHEENYSVINSKLFVEKFLTSWGTVSMQNSFVNIKYQLEAKQLKLEDTEIVVGGTFGANESITINKSRVKANLIPYTAKLNISNSDVIVDRTITSAEHDIQNSIIKANEFNGGTTKFNGVQLTVANSLVVQTATVENSIISTNTYKANGKADFNKTDLKVTTNYESGGASFQNSNLEIGGKINTGGGLFYVEGSNVKIVGDAHTANGSTIKSSVLNIAGYFMHTSKPLDAENSDIFVGGKVTATNGTDLNQVNMNVLGDYESSTAFKLTKTNLSIAGNVSLRNGGMLENSLMIADRVNSSTTLTVKGSVVGANYLKSDVMKIEKSEMCVKEFDVRSLTMDDDSKIYYSNTFDASIHSSNYKSTNVIKLSSDEFQKKCGVNSTTTPDEPQIPQEPGKMNWKPPVLDKVIY